MKTEVLILSLTTFVVIGLFVLSLPQTAPFIRAYCVLSRYGITLPNEDSIRIYCRKPTGRVTSDAAEAGTDNTRSRDLHDYDTYDFLVPYGTWENPVQKSYEVKP